jgi:type II secretory pathway pseudopilin PulG
LDPVKVNGHYANLESSMSTESRARESGFTLLESAVVVLVVGAVIAMATPRIAGAMREYRLNVAMHQMADLVHRVKTQAVSDNRKASLVVDTSNKRMGMIVYDINGNVVRTDYMPLPFGVNFATPSGVNAPVTGAPTSQPVSFPGQGGSTTVFQQDFNSRGFPMVNAGAINAVYLTNGVTYRAVTMNSVSATTNFRWEGDRWVDFRR